MIIKSAEIICKITSNGPQNYHEDQLHHWSVEGTTAPIDHTIQYMWFTWHVTGGGRSNSAGSWTISSPPQRVQAMQVFINSSGTVVMSRSSPALTFNVSPMHTVYEADFQPMSWSPSYASSVMAFSAFAPPELVRPQTKPGLFTPGVAVPVATPHTGQPYSAPAWSAPAGTNRRALWEYRINF